MDPNLDELLKLVGGLREKIDKTRGGSEVFRQVSNGEINVEEAVEKIFQVLREEGMIPELLEASKRAQILAPVSSTGEISPVIRVGEKNLINPLWEAALLERISLDGDVPELRRGPLPPGGTPAVPVILETTDPVVAGMMLERASQEVQKKILLETQDHMKTCQRVLLQIQEDALKKGKDVTTALSIAQNILPAPPLGIPGYMPGEVPALWSVETPTGAELLEISDERAQVLSHKALSTTQGRNSLVQPILKELLKSFSGKGFHVSSGPVPEPLKSSHWVVASYGAGDFSPRFNYVNSAIAVLREGLSKFLEGNPGVYLLEVTPYNGISTRTFGWEARIALKEA